MFTAVVERSFVLHLPISIAWCDVTDVYSFKVIAIHSHACFLGGILCASAVV